MSWSVRETNCAPTVAKNVHIASHGGPRSLFIPFAAVEQNEVITFFFPHFLAMIAAMRFFAVRPPRLHSRWLTAITGGAIFGFRPPIVGFRCFSTAGDGKAGAVAWLSSKMSKRISNMGALDVVKKAADKGDLQAITLMGVCHAIGYSLLSLPCPLLPTRFPTVHRLHQAPIDILRG